MRKQERDSDQVPRVPLFFIQMKVEGQTSFLCGSITLNQIIQIYIHTSYLHLLKNRNKNFFTPHSYSLHPPHTYIQLRDHPTMLRDGLISQVTQAHTEEKNFIPLNRPLSS